MRTKIIEFAAEENHLGIPQPAKKYVPEWYKKQERFNGGIRHINSVIGSKSFKNCTPFLDAITCGYTITLSQDIEVTQTNQGALINWGTQPDMLEERKIEINAMLPVPSEFTQQHFAWKIPYYFKTPNGYSVLVTHPLNRHDLPFLTLSGIVDSDKVMHKGNLPVLFKKDFKGIVPMGTPIAQVIPFKRENWNSLNNELIIKEGNKGLTLSVRTIGWYKNFIWKRKEYN